MSIKPFFPLRLESIRDLGIAIQDITQRLNALINGQASLTTELAAVKDDVEAGGSSGSSSSVDDVTSTAHGLAPRSPGDTTKFLNGDHTPDYVQVKGSDLLLADVTTNDVSSSAHGFAPKSPADATKFLRGDAAPVYAQVKGSDLLLADVTANDVSVLAHGFAPKLPNDVTKYLDGLGGYSVPGGNAFPPLLGTFPAISGLQLRLSAELSTMTINTDGYVAQINDLSGNWGSNFTAFGGTAARPRLVKRAMAHTRPGLVFDGVAAKLVAGATKTIAQPLTVVSVFMNWKGGANNNNVFRDSNFGPVLFQGVNNWSINAGTTIADNNLYSQNTKQLVDGDIAAPAIAISLFNGASSAIYNNGVATSVTTAGSAGISGTMYIGGDSSTSFMHGILYEILIFNKALSGTEMAQLNAYYAAALDIYL